MRILTLWFFLVVSGMLGGCQYFSDSYDSAASLDQAGKSSQAIGAYQKYLKTHPGSSLTPKIYYRIAKNFEGQSNFDSALIWYEKVLREFPHTDEEIHALLDLGTLYQNKLKNPAKALDYNQQAFNRYMDNVQIKNAIQSLIDAQYQTATAQFTQKNYKGVSGTIDGVYKTFPVVFMAPDTRARMDSLADRSRRAQDISNASVDLIVLKEEIPFNKSYESDFPESGDETERVIVSPDGKYLASRRKGPNGIFYLYLAKVPAKGDQVIFKLIKQTFGAEKPSWSPDSQELVYWRDSGGKRRLERTNIVNSITQTLFYTKAGKLGIHPAFHPSGNKVAYIYEGRVCLINTGATSYKQLLKTKLKLDYTADLAWSADGTMIRCNQAGKHIKAVDELLVLDINTLTNPTN